MAKFTLPSVSIEGAKVATEAGLQTSAFVHLCYMGGGGRSIVHRRKIRLFYASMSSNNKWQGSFLARYFSYLLKCTYPEKKKLKHPSHLCDEIPVGSAWLTLSDLCWKCMINHFFVGRTLVEMHDISNRDLLALKEL